MKCDAYHQKDVLRSTYDPNTGKQTSVDVVNVGICFGTKECDECSCGGYMVRCDFYESQRMKARALESAESRLTAAQRNLSASHGSEETLQKKRNQVEVCQYIVDAVMAYK